MYDLDLHPTPSWSPRRPVLHDLHPGQGDFRAAAIEGLSRPAKALPCRFLYDAQGSALFDQICTLAEYYPTRTEIGILRASAAAISGHIGPGAQLIELGAGSAVKVRVLLDALDDPAAYVPIDISAGHLAAAAQAIADDYPQLAVEAICADFAQDFVLPPIAQGRRVGFYPGSTIGNFTPLEAQAFLHRWARRLGPGAGMLIGVDLRKSADILGPAYDDPGGVTAAFSLNLLARANRELGANFDLGQFRHHARYDEELGRVAIHLRSLCDQTVAIGDRAFSLTRGEDIHVEDSWKYSLEGFEALSRAAGFEPTACWTDAEGLFSVHWLEAAQG